VLQPQLRPARTRLGASLVSNARTHARTHARAHARAHTRTHARTHARNQTPRKQTHSTNRCRAPGAAAARPAGHAVRQRPHARVCGRGRALGLHAPGV
jgi:hypothetical protein